FYPSEPLERLLCSLSALYDFRREKPASGPGVSDTNFVRKSIKYWVKAENVSSVIVKIISHLPIFHFKGSDSRIGAAISSVYFDNSEFFCYKVRFIPVNAVCSNDVAKQKNQSRLNQDEGATLIRIRW